MTRSENPHRPQPHRRNRPQGPLALSNQPYVSEPFGDFPGLDPAWADPTDPFAQTHQTAHDEFRAPFLAADDDEEVEDDEAFDDEDDLLDDEDEEDDFFDDDEDDFDDDDDDDDDDDEDEEEDEESYFFGDDD